MNFNEFKLEPIHASVSSKTQLGPSKPCEIFIEIAVKDTVPLNYIYFKNHYSFSITVKQLEAGDKADANWVTVLNDLKLMNNAHFEGDAQNWHMLSTDNFNSNFDRKNLKYLRIYLKQPSPNWIDYSLKNIQCFTRKPSHLSAYGYVEETKKAESPFEKFCNQLSTHQDSLRKHQTFEGMPFEGKLGPYEEMRKIDLAKRF